MAKDKPSFLQNIGDDEEEKEILSVLEDEETPEVKETEKSEQFEEPEKPEEPETPEKPEFKLKGKEAKGKKEEPTPPAEEKPAEPKLILGKYKTQEELEKAYKTLENTLRIAGEKMKSVGLNLDGSKRDDPLNVFRKTAYISATLPDVKYYYQKDNEGNEIFDIQSYMEDSFKAFALAIQQNLLGGPLAAAIFSQLSDAMKEEFSQALSQSQREEQAADIWNKIQTEFPILKTNLDLQGLFEKAIYGEKYRRGQEAQAKNEQPVDLTLEDYLNLAKTIVSGQPSVPAETPEEPTEEPKGDVVLKGKAEPTTPETEILRDIDDMMALKKKTLF